MLASIIHRALECNEECHSVILAIILSNGLNSSLGLNKGMWFIWSVGQARTYTTTTTKTTTTTIIIIIMINIIINIKIIAIIKIIVNNIVIVIVIAVRITTIFLLNVFFS